MKLTRSTDILNLLSHQSSVQDKIVLKPDFSPQEKKTNSLLWQSGIDCQLIKIQNSTIILNGKVHGKVTNGVLELTSLRIPLM